MSGGGDEVSYGDSNMRGRSAGRHNFFVIELCKKIVENFKKNENVYIMQDHHVKLIRMYKTTRKHSKKSSCGLVCIPSSSTRRFR